MDTITLVPTSALPEMGYKFESLNPFQSQFFKNYAHLNNAVVSAPTGSGKTVVAEIAINNALQKGRRAIFLAPMRSLVREKFDDWSAEKHPFSEFGVSIMTGDYKLTTKIKKELLKNKLIAMTSEMLDSRSRRMKIEGNKWLLETDVLIVDEAHIIGMNNDKQEPLQERGHKLEAALMRFSKLNPGCKIILLSATLPNLPELGMWLTKLNGKETDIIVSDYRPQPVEWHVDTYSESIGWGTYHINKSKMRDKALEILNKYPNDMWLVFCHSKTDGRAFQTMLMENYNCEIPFHCADLDADERIKIETNFKAREHQIILATSTLAYGVNLPARRVMILDALRGLNKVHPYDIKQMGGRAGRPGIDPCGDVHWILGDRSADFAKDTINNIPPAKSQMFDLDVFAFHIVAEIAEGGIVDIPGVKTFYDRCLACHQGATVTEEWLLKLIQKLVECKAITQTEDKKLFVTALGRVASWLYFSPFDIYHWYCNMMTVVKGDHKSDAAFAFMWASIRSNSMSYIPKDCTTLIETMKRQLNGIGNMRGCETACLGIWLQMQGMADKIPSSAKAITRNLMFDVDRYLQAMKLIDSMYAKLGKEDGLTALAARIKYGVGWDAAKLCALPGIGKVRAEKLIKAGIKNFDDMVSKREECVNLIGEKTYIKATSVVVEVQDE